MDEALRVVEERNSSRNLSPAATAVGLRVQSAGTTVGAAAAATAAVAALVSVSALLASSVKLTFTLIVVPWSAATSVWVLAVAEAMFVSVLSVATRIHWYV